MNTDIKKKVNAAGTVGFVISIILLIVMITGLVCSALGTAVVASIPGNEFKIVTNTDIEVEAPVELLSKITDIYDDEGFQENLEADQGIGEVAANTVNGEIKVSDNEIGVFSIIPTDKGFKLVNAADSTQLTKGKLVGSLVVTMLYLASVIAMLYMLKFFMKELKTCDTPFADGVIKRMQNFGYSLIPMLVMSMIVKAAWTNFVSGNFDLSLDITGILILAVVFMLTMVFRYGAELQKQSDETL